MLFIISTESQMIAVPSVSMTIFIYKGVTKMHNGVSFFLSLSLSLCVCMYVVDACAHVCVHKEARGQHQVSSSSALHLILFKLHDLISLCVYM